ncbi:hypothetical protein ACP3TN_04980 [Staphylococcus sp. IPLA37011]|uniref:hypothetical protein n=1 Tax=Staphylococcus TaxID=1279 RepID=UPI00255500C1|nr:hypothetical protein [Staphylococcus equorum]MDK9870813.1 hypothetical protein [Staphylococcus equorum]MDK9876211.1 hypothetical protein [Staphylococcus equorum]MDN5830266.1 hypothetical protein [Staphylococcus equorum]
MNNQALNIVPTRENTVISDEQVAIIEPKFARPKPLAHIYGLSPSTTNKYIREAEENKHYQHIVFRPSPWIIIVDIKGFKNFLEFRQKRSFSKISL